MRYIILCRKDGLCALVVGSASAETVGQGGGRGRGGWGHPQSAVHMATARLGLKRAIVGQFPPSVLTRIHRAKGTNIIT